MLTSAESEMLQALVVGQQMPRPLALEFVLMQRLQEGSLPEGMQIEQEGEYLVWRWDYQGKQAVGPAIPVDTPDAMELARMDAGMQYAEVMIRDHFPQEWTDLQAVREALQAEDG